MKILSKHSYYGVPLEHLRLYKSNIHLPSHCKIGASALEAPILLTLRGGGIVCIVLCLQNTTRTQKCCVLHTSVVAVEVVFLEQKMPRGGFVRRFIL